MSVSNKGVPMGAEHSPLFFLVYEDETEGALDGFVARSLMTGHVCTGSTRELAVRCLLRTIQANVRIAIDEREMTAEQWLMSQRPDDDVYAGLWVEAAKEHGVERVEFPQEPGRVALVNAA